MSIKIFFENILLLLIKYLLKFWLKITKRDPDDSIYETIEELIEEKNEDGTPLDSDERILLGNVLDLRDTPVSDVMIPRAEITAISIETPTSDIVKLMHKKRMSRLLVYKGNIDNILGYISLKDIAIQLIDTKQKVEIKNCIHRIHFVSPTMHSLDLLLQMRESGKKMAAIIDEHGGIDGLVIFSNLIEEIIGEIKEADIINPPGRINIINNDEIEVDGHTKLKDLEEKINMVFSIEDKDEIGTVAGLVISIAGKVPSRGEVIRYKNNIEFIIQEANPRKIKRICIKKK